ncbi:ACP S-malonyltransferase [Kitasatospora sp. NPDC004669]|uniref:ACP S-malonyltransferase n=1 Tax=Kitasatospora sp. NPDC004669 TaxID=3154555 RepID=UPI0033B54B0C
MGHRYAFLFPGQGSQHVGMGADLYERSPFFGQVLRRAGAMVGQDIEEAVLVGPAERLTETVPTQLSVLALSCALTAELDLLGLAPAVVAGHSLGEYSALVAGGWLDLDDALVVVANRAAEMADCCVATPGAMAAVLGMDPATVRTAAAEMSGTVVVANANSPRQSVVSGESGAVRLLSGVLLERGAKAVIPLEVHGAFHSPLMAQAEHRLAPLIADLPLHAGHTPLISSMTGRLVTDLDSYRRLLARQIAAPVEWVGVMETLRAEAVDTCIEVGPGTVLRGLLRQFDRKAVSASCAGWGDAMALTVGDEHLLVA